MTPRTLMCSLALLALGSSCNELECPDGSRPVTQTRVVCDEETRECVETSEQVCPCSGPDCDRGSCHVQDAEGRWREQTSSDQHVVDGQFTGDEWRDAERLEGLFTDVYVDYHEGRLYFLNDWRANVEGIRPDCFNYFQIRVGETWFDLRVYGDGHVEVERNGEPASVGAEGAYGFGPSPTQARPHTIYEFSLPVTGNRVDVCCFDPLTRANCDMLAHEPAIISISARAGQTRVRRAIVDGSVNRLSVGEACGDGQGICADGLTCEGRVCAGRPEPVDASVPDAGPGAGFDAGPPDPPM